MILFVAVLLCQLVYSQQITGSVEADRQETNGTIKKQIMPSATVYWANTTKAVTTDDEGNFSINRSAGKNLLVASFTGFESDTIIISKFHTDEKVIFILKDKNILNNVLVSESRDGQYIKSNSTTNTQYISLTNLEKLPCCNLSESFENNASVDVSFADAVTGAKQIQMLGLAGNYTQILTENMPSVRGLATSYGLAYIPGPWLESIQVSKGTSSVINGYESITGQINTELKKPDKGDKIYLNVFGNQMGKAEVNFNTRFKINEKLNTMFLTHASAMPFAYDMNNDGFLEMPITNQINFVNRWKYGSASTFAMQFGVKVLHENRMGGQMEYINNDKDTTGGLYGIGIETKRYEAFAKFGFPIKQFKGTSIGTMYSASYHEQKSFFGHNVYNANEKSLYANIILETILFNTNNKLNVGSSFLYDNYDEQFNGLNFDREEIVPGIFTQYTYSYLQKFSLILGIRADFHNIHGTFFTPRAHAKYDIAKNTTLRLSAGKGYRTANIFSENTAILASSRQIIVEEELRAEEGWNYGGNIIHKIKLFGDKNLSINLDYYRTDFENQIVVDVEANSNEVRFYNLRGKSYSNSFQAEVSAELFEGFDISVAARYNDVKIDMNDHLIEKPLVNKYKGLVSLSYATKHDKWVFDITNQFNGAVKLPSTANNPVEYQLGEYSESFYILHCQIARNFRILELYVGAENLTNYTQKQSIIASEAPFGNHFDTSIIWAPLVGRTIYAGLRLKLK